MTTPRSKKSLKEALVLKDAWTEKLLLGSFCCTFFFLPIATSPTVIAGAIALGVWVFSGKIIKDRHKYLHQQWFLPVIFFMLLPIIGLLWSENPEMGLRYIKKSYYWLYAFAMVSLAFSQTQALMASFLSGLALMAAFSILEHIGLIPMVKAFVGIINPLPYATLLVFGLCQASFWYKISHTTSRRLIFLILMVLYFLNLSITVSRTGYIELFVVAPLIFYNIFGKESVLKITAASALIVAILFLSPMVQNRVKLVINDAKSTFQGDQRGSFGERMNMWSKSSKIFLKHPLLGVGTGGLKEALEKYRLENPKFPSYAQPHNGYLYLASCFGIIGLVSFFWLLAIFLKKGWQSRHNLAGFCVFSYGLVFFIGNLTDTQILSLATAKMFALLTGLKVEAEDAERG